MKTMKVFLLSLFVCLWSVTSVISQCAQNNTLAGNATPPCPGTMTITNASGGTYYTVNVVAGNIYTFATCGVAAFDTQLTVYNGAAVIGYNDDGCGTQSTITWTATFTGTVTVYLDQYNCQNTGTGAQLQVTCSLPVQSGNGCNTNTTICTPGIAGPFGFSTPGTPVGSCLDWIGLSYAYVVLYITQSGPLEMLLDGNSATGFLDVAIFNVPNGVDPCDAIENPANEISCNYASSSSGCNQIGTYFPCASSVPSPMVNAGDVLMIVVENWSNASTNFTLQLAPSPAAQTGPPDPAITPVGPLCTTDPALQLNAVDMGGTWTGPGVSASGMFNPASVGPGTYTINYSIGSGPCQANSSTSITVNDCTSPCFMNYISVNVGACDPNDNTFDLTGQVQFTNAPTTGQLVITDCNGYQQTFSPPFASPTLYTISNIPSNGTTNCQVTAYFTADPACTLVSPTYNNPTSCTCSADAGTFNQNTTGSNTNSPGPSTYNLCFGDQLNIAANGDYQAPDDYSGTIAAPYDPGLWLLIYDCPPTVTPSTDINTDPCLVGVESTVNGNWSILNNVGDGSTYWFVPVTMYSMVNGIYAISINGGQWCYDLGPTYQVTFLEDIVANVVENCQTGSTSVTVSGGQPAETGSNFTASNLLPASASLSSTTVGNNGTFTITGLQDGNNYSLDITDATNCSITVSGVFNGLQNPAFSYPQPAYCQNAANPSPTITGTPGGSFTVSPAGLSINASSGLINLGASTPGTYTVTYTTPDPICFAQSTFVITVNPLPVVDGNDVSVCAGGTVTLNGTGANTYVWSGGVVNGVAFTAPAATTTYTVSGTNTSTGCVGTGNALVTVTPVANPSFTTTSFCAGSPSPAATITGTVGGTFSYSPNPGDGSSVNPASGSITGGVAGTTYTIQYNTGGACPASSTQTVTVYALPVVNLPNYSVCTGGTVTLTATGATNYTWSPGTYLNQTTGASVNSTPAANITYTVTGTNANGCQGSDAGTVTILANAPINAGPDVTICSGESTVLTASGGVNYTWLAPIGAIGATQTVAPLATTNYTVNGTDANGCAGSDQVQVVVSPLPTAVISGGGSICINSASPAPVITFTGANGTAPYIFTYNINGGASQTITSVGNTATITAPINVAGIFNYNLVSVSDASATICDQLQVGTATVTVNALPIVSAGPDQTVCQNTSVTLSGSGANSYVWNNGVSNGVAFTPAVGAVTYTVTGTNANGCVNTDQVNVTVNPLPAVSAGPDQAVCLGSQVTLSGSGASSYVWNNGVSNGVAFTPALGSITYTVTGTDGNGCTNTDQVVVTVNPNPSPTINGASTYCIGSSSTLSTSVPYSAYAWSNFAVTPTVNVQAGSYTVTVTDANGCQGTSPAFVVIQNNVVTYNTSISICQGASATIHGNTQTVSGLYSQTFTLPTGCDSTSNVTLVVNPLPAVNAGANQTVCTGVQTTLTASGAQNYVWSNGVNNGVPFTQAIGTVTYTVTGTDINGCVNTDQVDIIVNPLPVVGAGPDQTVCVGAQVTLTGSGAVGYVWNNGVSNNVAFTPAVGSLNYTVTGTDGNGCQNTDQVNVTVNSIPVVNAGPDQTVCDGVQVTLSGSGATSYTWTNPVLDGVAFTQAVGTVTYTVTGTDANACQNTDQVDITVNPLPAVTAGPDQIVCDGVQVTLIGGGANSYVWSNGISNNSPFTPTVGTTTYTVTGTDLNLCQNTDQVDVTVSPLPVVDAGPDQTVCDGVQVILSASGAQGYSWTNGVLDGQAFTPILGSTTYTVTGTDANGCEDTDQVVVTVTPLPVVFAGNDVIVCEGNQVVLTGSGAATYLWDNGVVNGVAFSPSVGTVTYTVLGTDANGCQGVDQVDVMVEALPVVSFTADVTSGCEPLQVTFTNTSVGNLDNCIWTLSNGTTLTGCGTVTTTFPNGGLYDVTLTTTTVNGCTSSATYTDYIYVEDHPIAAFTVSSSEVSILNPQIWTNNTSSGATSYLWNFGDQSGASTAFEPNHLYTDQEAGTYVIELIAYSPLGCPDTAYQTVVVKEEVIFYVPNTFTPDDDDYNETFKPVFTAGYDPFDYTILIFDRWGEIIWESHNVEVGWDGTYANFDVQDGTYIWRIEFKTTINDERIRVTGHVNVMR